MKSSSRIEQPYICKSISAFICNRCFTTQSVTIIRSASDISLRIRALDSASDGVVLSCFECFLGNQKDLEEIRECLDKSEENVTMNDEESVNEECNQERNYNEENEQNQKNEVLSDQGVKESSKENVDGIHSRSETPNEKLRSNVSHTFSYANVVAMNCNANNKLEIVPTHFKDVGISELRYNLRRMWGKFRVKDIIADDNNVFFFKFKHENGMNNVLELSPWLVNGKPLVTWNTKGISAIASRVGKLVIMDQVTADMCHNGGNEWNGDKRSNDNNIKKIYRPKQKGINVEGESVNKEFGESSSKNETNGPDGRNKESSPKQNIWRINKRDLENLKRSANKFAVLQDNDIETTYDMINYFKHSWEALEKEGNDSDDDGDMIEVNDMATSNLVADEIEGQDDHNEIIKLINNERLNMCGVLETHLKAKNINKVCDKVFGQWEWVSNIKYSPTYCRICSGWDPMVVSVLIIHENRQSILREVEFVNNKEKIVSSFVYAANTGAERRELWKDLSIHKRIADDKPWIIIGDFNVTLKPEEHSVGSSVMTNDMNPDNSILKKLDRMMINEAFMEVFGRAYGVFLPYMVYDHSPDVISIPDKLPKLKISFKLSNFVNDKEEFRDIVKKQRDEDVKDGNLFKKANHLQDKLVNAQKNLNDIPFNDEYRVEAAKVYDEYKNASEDEIKLLQQQAKIK
ncbi:RNA-directed DNA polymerase, eukaryota, reverse transcriptase zinc-binding domain protein [Tanacetum coccineum]